MDENDWVRCVKHFELKGRISLERPRKTWDGILRKDLERNGTDRQVVCT